MEEERQTLVGGSEADEEWPLEYRSDLAQAAGRRTGPQQPQQLSSVGDVLPALPTALLDHHQPSSFSSSRASRNGPSWSTPSPSASATGHDDDDEDAMELGLRARPKGSHSSSGPGDAHGGLILADDVLDERELLAKVEPIEGSAEYTPLKGQLHFRRLFAVAKPEWLLLLGGTISLIISSGSMLLLPQYAGDIIDAVSKDGDAQLYRALISLGISLSIGAIFTFLRFTFFTIAGERVVARLRKMLFAHVTKQEIAFFDVNKTGELVNRLSSDCTVLQNAVTVNISMVLRYSAQTIGGIFILFFVSWKLAAVMMSVTPVVVIGAVAFGRFVKNMAKAQQDAQAEATAAAEGAISSIRTVRSFAAEILEAEKYDVKVEHAYILAKKMGIVGGVFASGVMFAASAAILLVLWVGGKEVLEGRITTGTLTSFILYTLTVAAALGGLSSLYGDFMKAIGASTRVFQLLDRKPKIAQGGRALPQIKGEIQLEDVYFAYPSRKDVMVLHGVSLRLSPGKIVALVGPSGGGKSTIVHMIERFYDPLSGAIYLDNIDIRDLDYDNLHRHIGLVSQEPVLFAASIADNIRYGCPKQDIPMEEIQRAAKLANAEEFIERCPEKYETLVGERGITLSGGQKQRIAIARAILKNPTILLLDEATSALDAESERLVQDALDKLMQGRTVLVIAHRLSTVRNADLVCVVEAGRIVEKGTHDELLAIEGIYARLVRHQLQTE